MPRLAPEDSGNCLASGEVTNGQVLCPQTCVVGVPSYQGSHPLDGPALGKALSRSPGPESHAALTLRWPEAGPHPDAHRPQSLWGHSGDGGIEQAQ